VTQARAASAGERRGGVLEVLQGLLLEGQNDAVLALVRTPSM
jgi:hypothetical protein